MDSLSSAHSIGVPSPQARIVRGCFFWGKRVLLIVVTLIAALAAVGALYQAVATVIDQRSSPPLVNLWMSAATDCTWPNIPSGFLVQELHNNR